MHFNIMPRMYVWQFTLVLIAKCHSTISWIMSNYFPMNWFQDISMCIDSRQSIQLCPYHMGVTAYRVNIDRLLTEYTLRASACGSPLYCTTARSNGNLSHICNIFFSWWLFSTTMTLHSAADAIKWHISGELVAYIPVDSPLTTKTEKWLTKY